MNESTTTPPIPEDPSSESEISNPKSEILPPPPPLPIPDFVRPDLERQEIKVDEPALATLAQYLALLLDANKQFNLTAIREPDAAWRRHIIDSLTVLPGIDAYPPDSTLIDVGSGGGLPGIPLAIARPNLRVTLMEATGKKARFLETCIAQLALPHTRVIAERAEVVGQDSAHRQHCDLAVCRAIGPIGELLEYTLPLLRVGGRLLAMKGPKAEQELRRCRRRHETAFWAAEIWPSSPLTPKASSRTRWW